MSWHLPLPALLPPRALLPLPAHRPACDGLHQRGESDGVRGSHKRRPLMDRAGAWGSHTCKRRLDRAGTAGTFRRRRLLLPLPLTLSPQTGRGDPVGICLAVLLLLGLAFAPPAHAADLAFDLKITAGHVAKSMRVIRVQQGDSVKLRWTSDRAIVLHLHGYDIESKVEPGSVAEMSFLARATGRFSVEEHKTNTQGGHSHGEALVRIEVLPR
jgi:hypothetical protein